MSDWNDRFFKASQIVDKFNESNNLNKPKQPAQSAQASLFETFEIEFDDDSAPSQKSSPLKKLYDFYGKAPETKIDAEPKTTIMTEPPEISERKSKSYTYGLDGGILMTCKIEEWSKGFTLFADFMRDAKKYYKKTCINANYIYFFSYRPMYRELSHEQLCWYLFWRSRVREGTYPKTGLSYIFLYIYEQINLSDIIGCEKVYGNIIKIWKNYRAEFQRIDKYIAEWLIDFSLINKLNINLNDEAIESILPDILNIVTIPEIYLRKDFFKTKNNIDLIANNMSVYDYRKSKFYNEKNKELFDYHITQILHAVLSGDEFDEIIKKEIEDGVRVKTTRESFMGAVCVYEHKKRITVEYKNLYKNFFIRQCITDTLRYAENILRDYLNIKSKLTVASYPEELKKVIEEYRNKYLAVVKTPKITVKTKSKKDREPEEEFEIIEFNPNIQAAAEIEKSSWDTTMTLVELQIKDSIHNTEEIRIDEISEKFKEIYDEDDTEIDEEDDGEFIAIDTGIAEDYEELEEIAPFADDTSFIADAPDEDIFDVLENLETLAEPELTGMSKFIMDLNEEERAALEILLSAKPQNKSFDVLCGEFLSQNGAMLESVIDAINEKAMDFTGDIIFDTAGQEIIEDYREETEERLKKHE